MIKNNNDLKTYILQEIDTLANTVRSTLGPCGSNVILYSNNKATITKDGVSVARAIKDSNHSPIIDIIYEIANKTGNEAGDGTTSSTIFAQALVHSIYNRPKNTANLLDIKRYLDKYKDEAINLLQSYSKKVDNLYNIAKISCNGDEEISKLSVEIVEKTGLEGMISIKESENGINYIQYTEGLKWDSGYMSPNFITDVKTMKCEYDNVRIEIYNDKLTKLIPNSPLVKTMDICASKGIPLVLVVKDIEYDILNTLVYNNISGKLKVCVVKIPGHGTYKQDNIDDLKAIIGNDEIIDKVIITKHNTLFINKEGNETTKQTRIEQLKHRLTLPDENLEDLRKRIPNLNNGYATIYIGGNSYIEIKEKMDRCEDAICAIKSALEEGMVIGGGYTLKQIGDNLSTPTLYEEEIAYEAMKTACYSIMEQIIANYNSEVDYVYGSKQLTNNIMYYEEGRMKIIDNPYEVGLVDPTKVIRLIIENGVSIAGTLITTKCLIENERAGNNEQF